jgi:hypothetical protein
MTEKIIATGVIMFGAAAMIFARRFHNEAKDVGCGIAGLTIFIIISIWW